MRAVVGLHVFGLSAVFEVLHPVIRVRDAGEFPLSGPNTSCHCDGKRNAFSGSRYRSWFRFTV